MWGRPSAMGKAKKLKPHKQGHNPYATTSRKPRAQSRSKKQDKASKSQHTPAPTIPFLPTHRILLVGEGDFSFSHSLLDAHSCTSLIATSYDKQTAVFSKYPQARGNIHALEAEEDCKVIYGVDATKLGRSGATDGGGKEVKTGGFDRVVFNFPHVGGLTKDVNRQVRHNQGMIHMRCVRGSFLLIKGIRTSGRIVQISDAIAVIRGINCRYDFRRRAV